MAKQKKLETKVLVSPAQVKFFDTTIGKSVKTAIYLAISGALTAIVNEATNNPDFLGAYTQMAIFMLNNIGLVAVKNLFDPQTKNY
jgi:hypothetical protein